MKNPVHEYVLSLWDTKNPIRRHCLKILGAKPNRLEILQEISIILLQNYTRTLRTIEDGPENIELYTYKMANDFRKWRIAVDKSPKWFQNPDKSIPELDLYQFHEEPDLWAECMDHFLAVGVSERDRDIFFKHWREEHSQIYIAFKMEIPLSYVLKSLRMTLKIIRKHYNPNYKQTSMNGKWKVDKKRTAPKQTPETIAKQVATMKALPRVECPKCKRKLLMGMYELHGHGPNCVKKPIDPNHIPNPNRSVAYSGPKPTAKCPNCGKVGSKSNITRWHGKKGEKCENLKITQINKTINN